MKPDEAILMSKGSALLGGLGGGCGGSQDSPKIEGMITKGI